MNVPPLLSGIPFVRGRNQRDVSGKLGERLTLEGSGRISRYNQRSRRFGSWLRIPSTAGKYCQNLSRWDPHNLLNEGSSSGMYVSGRTVLFCRPTNIHNLTWLSG